MKRSILFLSVLFILFYSIGGFPADQKSGKMAITTSSEKARDYYLKGRDLFEKLRGRDSLEYFQKAVAEDPNMAVGYLQLAFTEPTAKGFFEDLKKAVALSNKASEGERLWILGTEAGTNGHPDQQVEYFKKLVAAHPNDERAHNILAGAYFGLQDYQQAINEYNKAIAINPNFSQPYNQLGYAYRFLEKYDDAEKTFKKYIELIPDDPNPYDSYAELLMKVGRYDESIAQYRKALSVDANFINSHIAIATDLNFKGQYEKAREELQTLMQNARDDGERRQAHFAMSVSYMAQGNVEQALAEQQKMYDLAKAINDPANMSGDLNTMGLIYLQANQPDQAKAKFDEALALISNSTLSADVKDNAKKNHTFNIGQVALKKNDLAGAKNNAQQFQTQVEAGKNRFQIWNAHQLNGTIALQEKNFDRAITELQQANQQNPQNLYWLAKAYEGKGDQAKAQETYKKVATFNQLNSLNYAFVRNDAMKRI